MADMMTFPDTWEEFEEQYGITDREEIYTNGARLIPSFRVKQWLDHIADRKTEPQSVTYNPTSVNNIWEKPTNPYIPNEQTEPQPCEWCKFSDGENCFSQEPCKVMLYFKTEPQKMCDAYCNEDCNECAKETELWRAEQTEPQTEEWHDDCNTCRWHDGACTIPCCDYEPKTEPSGSEKPSNCEGECDTCRFMDKGESCNYEPKTEPQTDCSWK